MKIPAIKGKIGETIYYIANLTFQQINQLVKKLIPNYIRLHLYTCFTEIENYIEDTSLNAAEQYRDPNDGGNIFFRPISLYPFISAIATLAMRGPEHGIIRVMEQFRNIDRTVSSEPWNRVIWNPITHKMVMRNQSLVKYLFMHMYNHDILTNKEKVAIKTKYAAVHNISMEDAITRLNNISIHNA